MIMDRIADLLSLLPLPSGDGAATIVVVIGGMLALGAIAVSQRKS